MKKWLKKMLVTLLLISGFLAISAYFYLQQPKFGKQPEGARLAQIEKSPRYIDGEFRNRVPEPPRPRNSSAAAGLLSYLVTKKDRPFPPQPVPTVKTDLFAINSQEDVIIWLGHSSYFIQLAGKKILIDPVFSDNAAPVPFANQAFDGANIYSVQDMPEIDYLLISHDHWDHLDYPSVIELRDKVKTVITALGVGQHFEHWGYDKDKIREADWNTEIAAEDNLSIHLLPAQHYSGRLLTRNKTLWTAFALTTPDQRLFFSGDSGYGPHFAEIGRNFGGFDLVILDSGQYNEAWRHIHMTPEDAVQAAVDLRAKTLLPAHIGKFSIAYHSWDDPLKRLSQASRNKPYRFISPMIGEPVRLNDPTQTFTQWWERFSISQSTAFSTIDHVVIHPNQKLRVII